MNAPQHGAQRVTDETPAWNLDGTDGTSSQDAIEPAEMAGPETGPSGTSITDAQRIAIGAPHVRRHLTRTLLLYRGDRRS